MAANLLCGEVNEEAGGIASALDGAEEYGRKDQQWDCDDGQPDSNRYDLLEKRAVKEGRCNGHEVVRIKLRRMKDDICSQTCT